MWGADLFGGFLRWMLRGGRTNLKDEISCEDGWFRKIPLIKKIPFIDDFENVILTQLFVVFIIVVLLAIGV